MENVRVLGIGFLLFLIGCETDGDAYRSGASGPAMLKAAPSNVSSAKQQASGEEQRKDSVPSCLGKTLGLESGIYGLPFSATTEEVMDWCVDNDMAIANPTEEDVKRDAKRAVNRIKDLKAAYDFEVACLPALEREIQKLAQSYTDAGDVFEHAKVVAAQERLEVLKNPTVLCRGQRYYLEKVHNGTPVEVDGAVVVKSNETVPFWN